MIKKQNVKTWIFLLTSSFVFAPQASFGFAAYVYNPEHAKAPSQTIQHLYIMRENHIWKDDVDRGRGERAIQHLKEFSEKLHENGEFDTAKLDQAIHDVKELLDANRMPPHDHDVLDTDIHALGRLRDHHAEPNYHY